jgi:hypothetical protein
MQRPFVLYTTLKQTLLSNGAQRKRVELLDGFKRSKIK